MNYYNLYIFLSLKLTLNMSESRERLIRDLSSSIFSPNTSGKEQTFRPKKRLSRDSSSEGFVHGMQRYNTPTRSTLRPLDHSPIEIFGDSPSEFYRKNEQGFYSSFFKTTPTNIVEMERKIIVKPPSNHSGRLIRKVNSQSSERSSVVKEDINGKIQEKAQNENSQGYILPKTEDVRVETLQIKGLRHNDDAVSIKQLCQGMHVIEINPNIDNVTGNCLGTAQIKLRYVQNSPSLQKLKKTLVDKGLEISSVSNLNGKKNNYHTAGRGFLDSQLQQEEKRLVGNNLSSFERKRMILGTSDDLFGNSPGCGKWDIGNTPRNDTKELLDTRENIRIWNSMRSSNSKSPMISRKQTSSGYLRPILSSKKKEISYKDSFYSNK